MNWWLRSNAGLCARIAIGAAIFAVFAILDFRANGRAATRWREYLFLLACVAAALVYGIVNDQITTTISWEYFAYGKGVAEVFPLAHGNSPAFRWEVAKIGMKATWSAGLIVGVAILIANNPRPDRPRLSYRRLARLVPMVFGITASTAIVMGVAGCFGAFLPVSADFRAMLAADQWHPHRFMCVYGIHLGGYIGALIGIAVSVNAIRRARSKGCPNAE